MNPEILKALEKAKEEGKEVDKVIVNPEWARLDKAPETFIGYGTLPSMEEIEKSGRRAAVMLHSDEVDTFEIVYKK